MFFASGLQRLERVLIGFIGGCEIVVKNPTLLFVIKIVRRRSNESLGSFRIKQLPNFNRRQLSIEHAEFIHRSSGESTITKALSDRDVIPATPRDIFVEVITNDITGSKRSVHKDLQSIGTTGAIISHHHMCPLLRDNGFLGTHANGIPRPEMNQGNAQLAIFEQKLVAATRCIRPGSGSVKHDRTFLNVGRLQPERNGKRMETRKIPDRQTDPIVTR